MPMTDEMQIETLTRIFRIRRFEERTIELMAKGQIPGAIHTSIGQEGAVVGACIGLRNDDYITGTHRSHAHPIAKGAALNPLMAELLGKRTGVCTGKGGSMHLADFSVGSLGETAIVGSALPIAVGAGLSARMRGSDQVCLSFFGDGATNTGAFHEALNLASIWHLPVVFLCENNQYALTTSIRNSTPVEDLADRAASYRMPGIIADGQDAMAVYQVTMDAVARARAGDGPTFIEAKTYRFREHAELGALDISYYRPSSEIESWKERDPLTLFASLVLKNGVMNQEDINALESQVTEEVDRAVQFARDSPFPDSDDLYKGLYTKPILIR
jgi:acetoin:2,6-dichlorophenolindophenol oxidoreductase subunit alpha